MGHKYLGTHLCIITKNANADKSSNDLYIVSHGGQAVGQNFTVNGATVAFYCPDSHILMYQVSTFLRDPSHRGSRRTWTVGPGESCPDYKLSKFFNHADTKQADLSYTDLEGFQAGGLIKSDIVSIRARAFHDSSVRLSWVISELASRGYSYLTYHCVFCRASDKHSPGWDASTNSCADPACTNHAT